MEIVISNLNKSFGKQDIFRNFNLHIKEKEFVVIYGISGKGKSTLLNLIGTYDNDYDGIISYLDNNKEIKDIMELRNKYLNIIFQNYALLESETVKYNLNLALLDKRKNNREKRIDDVLKEVNLLAKKNEKIYSLSGGEKQRIAIARCLLRDSQIILADEPTGNLDEENSKKIIDLLVRQNQNGKTIIVVTHDPIFIKYGTRLVKLV